MKTFGIIFYLILTVSAFAQTSSFRQWDNSHSERNKELEQFRIDVNFLNDTFSDQFYDIFDGNSFDRQVLDNPGHFDGKKVREALKRVKAFVKKGAISEPHKQSIAQWVRYQELVDKNIRRMELNWGDSNHYGSLPARIARGGSEAKDAKRALRIFIEYDFFILPLESDLKNEKRYRELHKTVKAHYDNFIGGKGGKLL